MDVCMTLFLRLHPGSVTATQMHEHACYKRKRLRTMA
jgi:hypothetical protein